MYLKKQTLQDDFGIWWDLPKYRNRDFEAKQYAITSLLFPPTILEVVAINDVVGMLSAQ